MKAANIWVVCFYDHPYFILVTCEEDEKAALINLLNQEHIMLYGVSDILKVTYKWDPTIHYYS
jgi:hypothetical protein